MLLKGFLTKTLLIMKFTAFLLLAACLHVAANGYAQGINLSEKNTPLEQVLIKIKQQSGYHLIYREEWMAQAKNVTLILKNVTVKEALDACFKNQPLIYSIVENTIVVGAKSATTDLPSAVALTPPTDIHGRVVNEKGDPVEGVTVTVKGTKKATSTNSKGEFQLTGINDNVTLVFTGTNVETREISISNNPGLKSGPEPFAVAIKSKVSALDEVQIIAYGTTTQRFNTGNISTIKAADIAKQPVNNPLLALEGRVPGMFITQSTGLPGTGITVRIQGQNSILDGNDPFYVIDGIPYVSQMLVTTTGGMQGIGVLGNSAGTRSTGFGGGNPLTYINAADIESIEILKDADATAIYGSRAANGAILITTKKGKSGQTKVDINLQTGWGKVAHKIDMLNTPQYLQMRREAFKNNGMPIPSIITTPTDGNYDINGHWDTTRYTDWQKELIGGTAQYTQAGISISGGTPFVQYFVGSTYQKETSVFPGDFTDQKGGLHFNINSLSANQKFKLQLSGNYMLDNNQLPGRDFTQLAIGLAPNAPALFNGDGTLNWALTPAGASSWDNPAATLYRGYSNKTNNLLGSAILSYRVISNLEIRSSFGYTNLQTTEFQAEPMISQRPENKSTFSRIGYYTNSNIRSWIIEPQVIYKLGLGKSKFDILIGSSIQTQTSDGVYFRGSGYTSDQTIKDIKSASTFNVSNTLESLYKYNAAFGRINYNFLDKYIINLSARRDGSSRFGSANRFHDFWAVGGAWIVSSEKLISENISFLSFGKLRGSYGSTGSDQIDDYKYLNLYRPITVGVPYQGASGLIPGGLTNPYLQWEETRKLQIGIDLGFFKDRILLSATYVNNLSSNQLLGYVLPSMTGFGSITTNFPATIQNKAWEFMLTSVNIRSAKFKWSSSFNLTIPRNKLVAFPNLANSSYASSLFIGQPLGVTRQFHFLGVDPSTGMVLVTDRGGNPTSKPVYSLDANVLANSLPSFYGGFQNSFEYSGFQLDFLFQFVKQKGAQFLYNNNPGRFIGGTNNQPVSVLNLNRWQKPGDNANFPAFSPASSNVSMDSFGTSDAVFSDASYVRLKNLSLSYQIPEKWKNKLHLQNGRIYMQGQNLLTFTRFTGMEPESQSTLSLPPLRIITMGLQVVL